MTIQSNSKGLQKTSEENSFDSSPALTSKGSPPNRLVDTFGRVHRSMRMSVTDQCNIRCRYCMPEHVASFLPQHRLMSFPQICQVVRVAASLGVGDYRITGGEPLMRPCLDELIAMLVPLAGVREIALTTNGMLLAKQLNRLVDCGLRRINISLDTLNEETFQKISRRAGLNRVLEGIEAALDEPRVEVRLNALVMRDLNLGQVVELVQFARTRGVTIRFIEFMPLDAENRWRADKVVTGLELRTLLSKSLGPLVPCSRDNDSQPSTDFEFSDGTRVGFIDSVTQPFCASCDRLLLTADGKLRNCLFGKDEWSVMDLDTTATGSELDSNDNRISHILRMSCIAKRESHGDNTPDFKLSQRAMYQIGG